MRQDKQPVPRREFDLNHVNLHSDVSVDRFKVDDTPDEEKRRSMKHGDGKQSGKPVSRARELFFSALLNLILAGVIGFLVWDRQVKDMNFSRELSTVKKDLSAKALALDGANKRIKDLEGNNQKLASKGATLSTEGKSLSSNVEKQKQEVARYKKELSALKKKSEEEEKQLKSSQIKYNQLKKNSQIRENDLNNTITSLQQQEKEKEATYQAQITEFRGEINTLRTERNSLRNSVSGYKDQIEEEARAGKVAMREQGKVVQENRALKADLLRIEKENKALLAQNKDLKEVTTGELVPFSSEITMPVPHYKEPIPKGLKWPRGTDVIVVHMLINESGAVSEIYYPQGQFIDTTFKSIMSPNLFKWKFSPPKYRNMNVKAWTPIIVREP